MPGRPARQASRGEHLQPDRTPHFRGRLHDRRHAGDAGRCSTTAASTTSWPTSKVIPIQKINEAFERMLKQDVKYRFVIDMSSLK